MRIEYKIFLLSLIAVSSLLGILSAACAENDNKVDVQLNERAVIKGKYIKQSEIESTGLDLQGPEKIYVERESMEISSEDIKQEVRNFLLRELPWKHSEMEINVLGLKESLLLPEGRLEYLMVMPKQTNYAGLIPILVVLKIDNREMKKIWVKAQVKVSQRVVVAKRVLRPNEIIEDNDLDFMQKDIDQLNGEIYQELSDIVGKKVKTLIFPEQIITSNMVEVPLLVKKGDQLTIVAKNRTLSVKITAQGKAEQNGREGDLIKVTNTVSKKEIQARILDSKTVLVEF